VRRSAAAGTPRVIFSAPSLHQARLACALAAATALACGGLLGAAALVPAPPVILVAVIVVSIGCTMRAGFELARGVVALRAARRARAELRGLLDALPETQHPLDR
jgi:hypothetical protein